MMATRVFVHGLESTARGIKGAYFAANFPDVILEDFSGTAAERVKKLASLLEGAKSALIVGSSYGGLVGAIYAFENPGMVKRLVLLAPALAESEFDKYRDSVSPVETFIFHGEQDDIVAPAPVRRIAKRCFPNLRYHLVADNHSLTATFLKMAWQDLLLC